MKFSSYKFGTRKVGIRTKFRGFREKKELHATYLSYNFRVLLFNNLKQYYVILAIGKHQDFRKLLTLPGNLIYRKLSTVVTFRIHNFMIKKI